MSAVLVAEDLLIGSRVLAGARQAGVELTRVDHPDALPPATDVRLVLVDWGARGPDWGAKLAAWCRDAPDSERPRLVLFGPHTDLGAHAAARAAGIGPMLARSRFLTTLPALLETAAGD